MLLHHRLRALLVIGLVMSASLLFTARTASSATYYVATTGADGNAGTLAAPWRTLAFAGAQLQAGDTLYIRGGTYSGSANVFDDLNTLRGGVSWSNPITISGYAAEFPVVMPPNGYGAISLTTSTQHHLIFKDFVVDGMNHVNAAADSLVYMSGGAHHNRILNLEIRNGWEHGIQVSNNNGNAPFNEILNNRIHHNGRNPGADHQLHGIYLFTSDNLIEGNDIYANAGYAVHIYNDNGVLGATRNIVRKNRLHDNNTSGQVGYGLVFAWGDGNLAYDNLIYRNGGGVQIYSNSSNAKVYNNTIYANTGEGIAFQYCTGARATNNIVFANGTDIIDRTGCGTLSNNLTSDPLFVNAAAADFHLKAGSAASTAGATLSEVPDDFEGFMRVSGTFGTGAYSSGTVKAPVPPVVARGQVLLAQSLPISVISTGPSLMVSSTTIAAGGTLTVTVANGPGNLQDWVGLFAPDSGFVFQFLNGGTTLTFTMPTTPGTYTLRVL